MAEVGAEPLEALPWRGSADARPALPVPPQKLPLRWSGTWRKRWRYVGAYDEAVMLCAAVARVGPAGETFWALWDRREGRMYERTRRLLPWGPRDVVLEGDLV